jgi:acyl-coenzyme A thioesterase PaaI-like protein
MDVTDIPFNQFMGLRKVAAVPPGALALDAAPKYLNHIGTVHAAAQFALAEACCGEYLLSRFADLAEGHLAVVRKAEIKYRTPAYGALQARASLSDREADKLQAEVAARGRGFVPVRVEILDGKGDVTMQAAFTWYVQKIEDGLEQPPPSAG